jgi:uncharacterized protein (DUF2147 family)
MSAVSFRRREWLTLKGVMPVALILTLLATSRVSASEPDAVVGQWRDERSVLIVSRQGESLSMRIHAMFDPVYKTGEAPGPVGAPRRDSRNPDASLQHRPILGLELLIGYAWSGERWEGQIYDPESGKTYRSHMTVDDDGQLAMRGYIGAPMFGRTAEFKPANDCDELVLKMLAASKVEGCAAGR